MQRFRKNNKLRIMCNSPRIMKFGSHQNISPRSGSSEMEPVTCQNGYQRRYYSWSDDKTYFANQIWYHFAIWVSKICISTVDILPDPEFIHAWSDTSRPLHHRQRNDWLSLRCCLPWRHQRVTWITCSPLWHSLIHRILKSSLPRTTTFFIATVSVAKDAAYWIVHAPFTSIVVFWHIGNVPTMIS